MVFMAIVSGRIQGVVAVERRQGYDDLRRGGSDGCEPALQDQRVR
jgi:hypothetical protein